MRNQLLTLSLASALFGACTPTSHAVVSSPLGTPRPSAELLAVIDLPGTVRVETVNSADWAVDRSGLINLEHETAKQAGLTDGMEPIHVYFHVLEHPSRGTFLIDTGIERALKDDKEHAALRGLAAKAFGADAMRVHQPLASWLTAHRVQLSGVLLTHLHGDHVLGLPDVPLGTPLYMGPGENRERAFLNLFVRPTMNRLLAGHDALRELQFADRPDARLRALDLFDDGMVWALHTPGHTKGSLAFVVRTPHGPVLFAGDTCHTAWGWEHEVEPGSFTADHTANAASLAELQKLVREHPSMEVRLGHQPLAKRTAQR